MSYDPKEYDPKYRIPLKFSDVPLRVLLGLSPRRYTPCSDGKTLKRERGITAQDIIIYTHKQMGWKPGMGYLPKRKAVA